MSDQLCAWCKYRTVPPSAAHGRPRLYCSDVCKARACRGRLRARMAAEADAVRDLVGLPASRGYQFTLPELEALHRRIRRLAPAGGMSRYPASRARQ